MSRLAFRHVRLEDQSAPRVPFLGVLDLKYLSHVHLLHLPASALRHWLSSSHLLFAMPPQFAAGKGMLLGNVRPRGEWHVVLSNFIVLIKGASCTFRSCNADRASWLRSSYLKLCREYLALQKSGCWFEHQKLGISKSACLHSCSVKKYRSSHVFLFCEKRCMYHPCWWQLPSTSWGLSLLASKPLRTRCKPERKLTIHIWQSTERSCLKADESIKNLFDIGHLWPFLFESSHAWVKILRQANPRLASSLGTVA